MIPLILMGGAGYMFLKGLSPAPAIDLRFLSGLFMIIILGLQVIIILMARGVRQQRRQRREGLFGE